MSDFKDLIEAQWAQQKFLCVGLDTDLDKIPEHLRQLGTREAIISFNRAIIDATRDIAGSYKPNSAYYEAHGDEGWQALRETIQYIRESAPDVPVILDAKRADIGSTNEQYARSVFDHLHADAVTVQPYPGGDALAPFFERKEKGIIVWVKASNPGSGEIQDLPVNGEPLYQVIAKMVASKWNKHGNCGVVVGATYPEELRAVREIVGYMPILIPGVGAQNGDLVKSVRAGKNARGGIMLAAARTIIFASSGKNFAEAARAKADELDSAIRAAL